MPPHQILRLVYQEVGDTVFRDSQRLSNLVKDYLCFQETARDQILVAIIKGIHIRILDSVVNENDDVKLNHCISTLVDNVGMTFENAKAVVEMLAYSMERISCCESESKPLALSFINELLCCEGEPFTGFAAIMLPDGDRYFSGQWEKGKPQKGRLIEKNGQSFDYSERSGKGVVVPAQ